MIGAVICVALILAGCTAAALLMMLPLVPGDRSNDLMAKNNAGRRL
jgi:hypothetical protein